MSAKLSQMSLSRVVASILVAAVIKPKTPPSSDLNAAPFFGGWDTATILVTLSFTTKSLVIVYLLKVLDGIQKNVGEALAVLVRSCPCVCLSA